MMKDDTVQDKFERAMSRLPWLKIIKDLKVINGDGTISKFTPVTLESNVIGTNNDTFTAIVYADTTGADTLNADLAELDMDDDIRFILAKELDTFLFLPITDGEFTKHYTTYVGYKFSFIRDNMQSIQLLDDHDNAMIDYTLMAVVRRVSYQTRGKSSIVIKHISDPISPGVKYAIQTKRSNFDNTLVEVYKTYMGMQCSHYMIYTDQ